MTIALYYFPSSHWSRIVTLALAEKGIEFDRQMVDIRHNASFDPDYLRLNPKGVVPTLRDGDRLVCNGPDIARHLDMIRPEPVLYLVDNPHFALWAKRLEDFPVMLFSYSVWVRGQKGENSASILDDKIERAKRLADEHQDLREAYLRKQAFFEGFRTQVYDPQYVAAMESRYHGVLDELGVRVAEAPFICGDEYSFADCIATSILFRLVDLGKLDDWHRDPTHGLSSYFSRVCARPNFRTVFVDDPLIRSL